MSRVFNTPVPSLRGQRDDVPDWLEQTVERALAKEAADRFATAAAFVQARRLGRRQVDRGAPVREHEQRPGERVLHRRHRGRDHQRADEDHDARRGRARLGVRVQGKGAGHRRDRRRSTSGAGTMDSGPWSSTSSPPPPAEPPRPSQQAGTSGTAGRPATRQSSGRHCALRTAPPERAPST